MREPHGHESDLSAELASAEVCLRMGGFRDALSGGVSAEGRAQKGTRGSSGRTREGLVRRQPAFEKLFWDPQSYSCPPRCLTLSGPVTPSTAQNGPVTRLRWGLEDS